MNMDFIVEERINKPSMLTVCFTSPLKFLCLKEFLNLIFFGWSISKSAIFFLATPLFIAALATATGITLINLGSKVDGII